MAAAQQHEETITVGALEIHPGQGLALAEGNALSFIEVQPSSPA